MTCREMTEDRLNQYVDGTLPAGEQQEVEQHLPRCAACREEVARLRELLTRAAALPRSIQPPHDLWAGIEARMNEAKGEEVRGKSAGEAAWFWRGVLAAAAVMVLAVGIYRLAAPPSRPVPPPTASFLPVQGWQAVEADYIRAADELAQTLAARRSRLSPQTVAVVEQNLRIIDEAIHESREALARDPSNRELRQMLSDTYQQKLGLLRQAARLSAES